MNRPWLKYFPARVQRRLDSRHNLQGVISNTGWLLFDKLFRMGVSLTLGILIARFLGPEDYGLLSYSIAFASIFATIATLGLDGVVVRDLAIDPQRKDAIVGSAMALKFAGGIAAYLIAVMSVALLSPSNPQSLALVAIIATSLVFQSLDATDFWFQSQTQARYAVVARGIAFVIVSAIKVWLLLSHASIQAFAWANVAEVALSGVALLLAFKAAGNSPSTLRVDAALARRLLKDSWPIAVSGMFVLLTMQLDKIMLGQMAGNAEVGIYSVASQMSSIWYMVPMIIGASIAPTIARSHATGEATYREKLQKVYRVLTHIAVAAAVAVSLVSSLAIGLLFGEEFAAAGPVLAIHVWGGVFVFHVSVRTRALIAEGKQRYVTAIAALTLFASIALNLFLIGRFGAQGAAVASLLAWALCAVVFPFLWSQTRDSAAMFLSSFKVHGIR